MNPSLKVAESFLQALAPDAEKFTFQTIGGAQGSKVVHGTLAKVTEQLIAANQSGAGIFVTVNETDFKCRKAENIKQVRAVFADLDGAPLDPILECSLKPHIVVESSHGKYHAYWRVTDCPLAQFKSVQQAIAIRFDSDPAVNDLPRVMRLPGFFHQKEEPFETGILELNEQVPYSLAEIIGGLSLSIGNSKPLNSHKERADINQPLSDGERTPALTELIGRYIKAGFNDAAILDFLRLWNNRNTEQLDDDKLISTLASIRKADDLKQAANDPVIEEFNEQHAVVMMGSKCVVLREQPDKVDFLNFPDFKNFYCNRPLVDRTTAANHWLQSPSRRQYKNVVFDPSMKAANDNYNLWQGFAVEPKEGDCNLYLEHILSNIASGDQALYGYLLDWMADAVQNPSTLPGVSLVLKGRQGTGKGQFVEHFGKLFGRHFKHVQSEKHLTGQFSGHLADALLILADEVVWGGNKQQEGVLKTLVTEKLRFVEYKHKDAIQVRNYSRVIMVTNNDWAVPAGPEERRFCVIEVGDKRMQDGQYFNAIDTQMKQGGYKALLHLLQNRDISKSDIRKFPKTQALIEQKELSFSSEMKWWHGCLKSGSINPFREEWPEWETSQRLYHLYQEEQTKRGNRHYLTDNRFFIKLKQMAPGIESSRKKISSGLEIPGRLDHNAKSRAQGYRLPSIDDCRLSFENLIGQEINWDG